MSEVVLLPKGEVFPALRRTPENPTSMVNGLLIEVAGCSWGCSVGPMMSEGTVSNAPHCLELTHYTCLHAAH